VFSVLPRFTDSDYPFGIFKLFLFSQFIAHKILNSIFSNSIGNCYDIFFDCDEVIKENPNFCSEDEEASRGCRKKCGLCNDVKPQPGKIQVIV
jgi:hypothetical protein